MKDFTNRGKLGTYLNNLKTNANEKTPAPRGKKMATEIIFGFTNDSLSSLKAEKTGQGFQFIKHLR